jgi:hypothetical protein
MNIFALIRKLAITLLPITANVLLGKRLIHISEDFLINYKILGLILSPKNSFRIEQLKHFIYGQSIVTFENTLPLYTLTLIFLVLS